MQRLSYVLVCLLSLLLLPVLPAAADNLGSQVVAGVQVQARISAVSPAQAVMGGGRTHRLSVQFRTVDGKRTLTKGLVAVKLQYPDGHTTPAAKLELVKGSFVGDLLLNLPGTYQIRVACRLLDGHKRQFSFPYTRP